MQEKVDLRSLIGLRYAKGVLKVLEKMLDFGDIQDAKRFLMEIPVTKMEIEEKPERDLKNESNNSS